MTKTANTHVSSASASRLETIRSVALHMFVNEGYQAVSMRQLADHAGLQAGSLYHYIESKQCLLFAFIEEHEYQLLHCLSKTALARFDPRSALGHYIGAYLRSLATAPVAHTVHARELLPGTLSKGENRWIAHQTGAAFKRHYCVGHGWQTLPGR
ncbi:TetR/AcrR family transcriptional regulator; helix-turn-helix transcriptional regulator [Pseudomonas sp. PDM31]|nr:TetR/AcrR family transcriptional regulator [Pseudomonas sp. PDM31]MBV7476603.1 TetR/AcrR family transcriptional regulator; helix-turn-helix transcriptional regulator [Pseudomonas sp. PDM31]